MRPMAEDGSRMMADGIPAIRTDLERRAPLCLRPSGTYRHPPCFRRPCWQATALSAVAYGSPMSRTRMAIVGFLNDAGGTALTTYDSILHRVKIPELPLSAFCDWEAIPIYDGNHAPKIKKLKGVQRAAPRVLLGGEPRLPPGHRGVPHISGGISGGAPPYPAQRSDGGC